MTITINQFTILLVLGICILIISVINLIISVHTKKTQGPERNISEMKELMDTLSGRAGRNYMPHEARRLMKDRGEESKNNQKS